MASAEKSIIPEYKEKIDILEVNHGFNITAREIINKETGSGTIFSGIKTSSGNQTANLKSIEGLTTWILDEAEELIDIKIFNTIGRSVRKKGVQNRIIMILNPCNVTHWIYQKYIKNTHKLVDYDGCNIEISTHKDVEHIHTTYLDNIDNLSQSFIDEAKSLKETNIQEYNHEFLGQWVKEKEGLFFKENIDYKIIQDIPDGAKLVCYGLDWGFSPDESAVIEIHIKGNDIYMNEILYKANLVNISIDEQNENTIDFQLNKLGVEKDSIIVCDSAEKKSIMELREKEWYAMPAKKGPDSIMHGINKMKSFNLYVTSRSRNLLSEFQGYTRLKDPLTGHYLPKPDPKVRAKHGIDAARYSISSKGLYWD
jgi:phage terminase large subunit